MTWESLGCTTRRLRPAELLSRDFDALLTQFANHDFQVMWVDLVPPQRFAPSSRLNAVWSKLRILLQNALRSNLYCCFAGVRKSSWSYPAIQQLAQDRLLYQSSHRWCHFGIRLSPDSSCPSAVCLKVLSSVKLPNHSCTCQSGQEHCFDLDELKQTPSRAHLRATAEGKACRAVLTALGACCGPQEPEMPINHLTENDHRGEEEERRGLSFPTEQKIAQREREKSAGKKRVVKKKKTKNVEQHFDDCGESLDGLSIPMLTLSEAVTTDEEGRSVEQPSLTAVLDNFRNNGGYGSYFAGVPQSSVQHVKTQTLQEAMIVLDQMPPSQTNADIVELCGGEGLTTFMCHKRQLKTGANFELITGVDLTDPQAQSMVKQYVAMTKPRVVVMGPICGPFGPLGNRNRVLHHEAWLRACETAVPLAQFCGEIAMCQLEAGRHFLVEQPFPSNLYLIEPWPEIRRHPKCLRVVFDQCQVGQTSEGIPVKKPTELVATDETLLRRFSGKICRNEHQHIQLLGGKAAATQKWTTQMCDMIAASIRDLAIKEDSQQHQSLYPAVSTDTGDGPVGGHEQPWRKCKGCLWRLNKFSSQHSRVRGECKYPDTEPMEFECPSCQADKPRSHEGHTFEPGCRHALTSSRTGGPKGVRETRAPRAARVPAHEEPTGSLRADASGIDKRAMSRDDDQESDIFPPDELDDSEPAAPASGSRPSAEGPRHRDSAPREPPIRHAEVDTQTPVLDDEWTKFDLQHALRDLHFGSPAQRRRLLRKLHLRWWHAGTTTMLKILRAAGSPKEVLELIPSIVDTCRICRTWAKPTNSIASGRLVTSFNHEVEADIVYVRHQGEQHHFLHLVDRAVKWCATCEIPDRSTDALLNAIDTAWVSIFGPMKILIVDGEPGLDNESSTWYFQVRGIEKRTAAVNQHPRIADRRVQILRGSIHKITTQLAHDGISMPFRRILAEATFVINAVSNTSGVSPYVAVMGRSPALMPELGPRATANDDRDQACPIVGAARVRELAVQTITEETARQRLRTALKTPTRPSGEEMEFKVGDSVEYFREPSNKDISGWRGPATIVDMSRLESRRVGIRTNTDQILNCRTQDIRHRLVYLAELSTEMSSQAGQAQQQLQQALEQLTAGSTVTLGQTRQDNATWSDSSANIKHRTTLQAALYLAEVLFQLQDVVAVRLARGIKSLPERDSFTHSFTLWWLLPGDRNIRYHESNETKVLTPSFAGDSWSEIRLVQYLCCAQSSACVARNWRITNDGSVEPNHGNADEPILQADRLSTIPEETEREVSTPSTHQSSHNQPSEGHEQVVQVFGEESLAGDEAHLSYLQEAAEELQQTEDKQSYIKEEPDQEAFPSWSSISHVANLEDDGLSYVVSALGESAFENQEQCHDDRIIDADEQGVYVAIEVPWPESKFVEGLSRQPTKDEVVEIRCYESHSRKAVIDRSDDLLTAEEMRANADACLDAMFRELKTWHDLKCFSRKPRSAAACTIDTRWVFKWKYVDGKRTIRARLTLRGFKEFGADNQSNFAATATKWSQRLIVSECVLRSWCLASTDISKAFLQGVSYSEIAAETGQPERDVNFDVCSRTVPLVQKLPGFHDWNPIEEVLHCLKPGTGCRDAPRAFSMQFRRATKAFGLVSSLIDSELELMYKDGQLCMMILKHVDDVKMAGPREQIEALVKHLSQTFGKLTTEWHNFTFCGIRHVQDPHSKEITLDQTSFLAAIKPMSQPEVMTGQSENQMPESLQRHFLSLLMTVAYAVQSRPDIAVYIAALQKESKTATFAAARRLNKVLLWAQKNPKKITYHQLEEYPDCLALVSDSAFKAREDDGLSMRGMIALRTTSRLLLETGNLKCHLLHTVSKTQRHVTRSTFASELFAATDSMDYGLIQILSIEELLVGSLTWEHARELQQNNPNKINTKMALIVDARSVTLAITAPVLKAPAENSALVSVAWLRNHLRNRVLDFLLWADTRVMISDGLTKGSINREGIHAVMDGSWNIHTPLILEEPRT